MMEQEQNVVKTPVAGRSFRWASFKQKLTAFITPHAKWLALTACVVFSLATFQNNFVFNPVIHDLPPVERVSIDEDYVASIGYLLGQGKFPGGIFTLPTVF
jgi:hypothetical protein